MGSDTKEPFLYDGTGKEAAYVALSHCWGHPSRQPLITTTASLQERKRHIPLSAVPPTFLDAILLTRKLGIDYLWIDSLCIIQDDLEDWAREGAQMSVVYQNATLTLSADSAVDSSGGLLKPVGERRFRPAKIIHVPGDAENGNPVYAREISTALGDRPGELGGLHMVGTQRRDPLSQRAWVLQEWLLSRRIAHFCSGELFWECNTGMECECQLLPCSPTRRQRLPHEGLTRAHFHPDPGQHRGHLRLNWPQVVREFTKRQLTQERDRLPALSGLAAFAKEHAAEDYACGLWNSELPESLLWSRYSDENPRRLSPYYAPTWSWASVTGAVWYVHATGNEPASEETRIQPRCEVIEVSVTLASSNPFGPARSGFLKLRGRVGRLPRHWQPDGYPNLWVLSSESSTSGPDPKGIYPATWDGEMVPDVTTPSFEFGNSDELWLIIVASTESRRLDTMECLALRKMENDEMEFKRVGIVTLMNWAHDWRSWLSNTAERIITII